MGTNKKISVAKMVENLKANGEDFEWYPTTKEIIESLYWDIKSMKPNPWFNSEGVRESQRLRKFDPISVSILDIGAGNCKVFSTIKEISQSLVKEGNGHEETHSDCIMLSKYMAIEKSQQLIDAMPHDVFIVGTEFDENTLIDKRADVVFCNPPYSQYAQWSERIIKEANADYVYLVIPQRWGANRSMRAALKARNAKVSVVGTFDFLNSEDRKARAKVSLLKIQLVKEYSRRSESEMFIDPFTLWFNETFQAQAKKVDNDFESDYIKRTSAKRTHKEKVKQALVSGRDLVTNLVELYNHELEHLIGNYKKVMELDPGILKELGVQVTALKGGLQEKISGLKVLYWEEIFDNLTEITSRLTSKSRDVMMKTLMANTSIDFTASNVYSVVIWSIKNANKYYDSQMIDVYDDFTSEEGLKYYKSNTHFNKDSWRYCRADMKEGKIKYALDYRIVLHDYRDYTAERNGTISQHQMTKIRDLIVVAKNLGFVLDPAGFSYDGLRIGEKENLYFHIPSGRKLAKGAKTHIGKIQEVYELPEEFRKQQGLYQYQIDDQIYHENSCKIDADIFTTIKGFKNGNTHFQMNQLFIKKLNLEVGRLRGWIKSPAEAAEEFDISVEEANEYWNSSYQMLPSHVGNLLPSAPMTVDVPDEIIEEMVENQVSDDEVIMESIEVDEVEQSADLNLEDEIIISASPAMEANIVRGQQSLFDDVA